MSEPLAESASSDRVPASDSSPDCPAGRLSAGGESAVMPPPPEGPAKPEAPPPAPPPGRRPTPYYRTRGR